jgi:hypothetical protein
MEVAPEGVGVEVEVLLGEARDLQQGDVVGQRGGCRRNLTEAGCAQSEEPKMVESDLGYTVRHEHPRSTPLATYAERSTPWPRSACTLVGVMLSMM